jgi:hypothetical protein
MQPESISVVKCAASSCQTTIANAVIHAGTTQGGIKNFGFKALVVLKRMTEICNSSREPKWAKTPDLLMPVTSAKAPIDKPSKPICEAKPKRGIHDGGFGLSAFEQGERPLPSSALRVGLSTELAAEAIAEEVMCLTVIFTKIERSFYFA